MFASGTKATAFKSYSKMVLKTAAQSIPHNSWEKVAFNNVEYDNLSECDITTNYRWTATQAGVYHVSGILHIATPGTANPLEVSVNKNGGYSYIFTSDMGVATISHNRLGFSGDIKLAAGEYLECYVHQYAGAARDLAVDSFMAIRRVA